MNYRDEYRRWAEYVTDPELLAELNSIRDEDAAVEERFRESLSFGTAGLRGVLGAGTNRMNRHTVGWATQGLADYINERYGGGTAAIGYDSRHKSRAFAEECAAVLAANGITAYLFGELMPTPMLSFAVRELGCKAGIMITASHNPAQYNGYKAYGSDGCQMTVEDADAVLDRLKHVDVLTGAKRMDFARGVGEKRIRYITKRVTEHYYQEVKNQQINPGICQDYPLKAVYTPLNGTGNVPVRRVLSDVGLSQVFVVKEQELPDGDFPTAPYPNPELPAALELALAMSRKLQPEIMLATDPDADRVGFAVRRDRDYRVFSGNEIGVLLLHYIITARKANRMMPKDPVAVRSVVSTPLADKIAAAGGVEMRVVLTGFKYIGEQILFLEQEGRPERFIFGFEESCGYLAGSYVRDKDAVFASMILAEMTSYFRSKGSSLPDVLEDLFRTFGYYQSEVENVAFPGLSGAEEMRGVISGLRARGLDEIAGMKALIRSDYASGEQTDLTAGTVKAIGLPRDDMLEYRLENDCRLLIRPSGTEPKLKAYLTAAGADAAEAKERMDALRAAAKSLLGR